MELKCPSCRTVDMVQRASVIVGGGSSSGTAQGSWAGFSSNGTMMAGPTYSSVSMTTSLARRFIPPPAPAMPMSLSGHALLFVLTFWTVIIPVGQFFYLLTWRKRMDAYRAAVNRRQQLRQIVDQMWFCHRCDLSFVDAAGAVPAMQNRDVMALANSVLVARSATGMWAPQLPGPVQTRQPAPPPPIQPPARQTATQALSHPASPQIGRPRLPKKP